MFFYRWFDKFGRWLEDNGHTKELQQHLDLLRGSKIDNHGDAIASIMRIINAFVDWCSGQDTDVDDASKNGLFSSLYLAITPLAVP